MHSDLDREILQAARTNIWKTPVEMSTTIRREGGRVFQTYGPLYTAVGELERKGLLRSRRRPATRAREYLLTDQGILSLDLPRKAQSAGSLRA